MANDSRSDNVPYFLYIPCSVAVEIYCFDPCIHCRARGHQYSICTPCLSIEDNIDFCDLFLSNARSGNLHTQFANRYECRKKIASFTVLEIKKNPEKISLDIILLQEGSPISIKTEVS